MEGAKTKFCRYCGKEIPIDTKKCPFCNEWQEEDENISRNHFVNAYVPPEHKIDLDNSIDIETDNKPEEDKYSNVLPVRRQLLLLIIGGGLYNIWWYYKSCKNLKEELNRDINPLLYTIAFIIPILNWVMYYILLNYYREVLNNENIESYSPIKNTLLYIFLPYIGSVWTFVNVQESINNLWYKKQEKLPVKRNFTTGEKVFMVIIILIIISIIILILLSFTMTFTGTSVY